MWLKNAHLSFAKEKCKYGKKRERKEEPVYWFITAKMNTDVYIKLDDPNAIFVRNIWDMDRLKDFKTNDSRQVVRSCGTK